MRRSQNSKRAWPRADWPACERSPRMRGRAPNAAGRSCIIALSERVRTIVVFGRDLSQVHPCGSVSGICEGSPHRASQPEHAQATAGPASARQLAEGRLQRSAHVPQQLPGIEFVQASIWQVPVQHAGPGSPQLSPPVTHMPPPEPPAPGGEPQRSRTVLHNCIVKTRQVHCGFRARPVSGTSVRVSHRNL